LEAASAALQHMIDEEEEEPWPEDLLAELGVTRAQMQHMADIRELFEAEVDKERAFCVSRSQHEPRRGA
jgi:hypothetical protein